jgi:hypothetical protein
MLVQGKRLGVMANLREWRSERLRQGRLYRFDEKFYPAFCANSLTAVTTLSSRFDAQIHETRHFRDFLNCSLAFKKTALASAIISQPLPGMIASLTISRSHLESLLSFNEDCLLNILSHLPLQTQFAFRNTCHSALSMSSSECF